MGQIDTDDLFPADLQPEEVALRKEILLPTRPSLKDEYNPEDWMTTREVSEFFRVDPKTVKRWQTEGKLDEVKTFVTPGGHHRFSRPDIKKIVESHENGR